MEAHTGTRHCTRLTAAFGIATVLSVVWVYTQHQRIMTQQQSDASMLASLKLDNLLLHVKLGDTQAAALEQKQQMVDAVAKLNMGKQQVAHAQESQNSQKRQEGESSVLGSAETKEAIDHPDNWTREEATQVLKNHLVKADDQTTDPVEASVSQSRAGEDMAAPAAEAQVKYLVFPSGMRSGSSWFVDAFTSAGTPDDCGILGCSCMSEC